MTHVYYIHACKNYNNYDTLDPTAAATHRDCSLLGAAGDYDVRSQHRQSLGRGVSDARVPSRDYGHLSLHAGRSGHVAASVSTCEGSSAVHGEFTYLDE